MKSGSSLASCLCFYLLIGSLWDYYCPGSSLPFCEEPAAEDRRDIYFTSCAGWGYRWGNYCRRA